MVALLGCLGCLLLLEFALALLGLSDLPPVVFEGALVTCVFVSAFRRLGDDERVGGNRGEQLGQVCWRRPRNVPGFSMLGILNSRANSGVA